MTMRPAFFLLMLLGLSFADCILNATEIVLGEQGGLIMIVLMVMTAAIGLSYMFGAVTHNPSFTVFAKDELFHLGFSVLLLVVFSGIVLFSCETANLFMHQTFGALGTSMCYNPTDNVNDVALCYVDVAKNDARAMSERYIESYIGNLMDSTYAVSIAIPLFNAYTATTGAYLRIVSNQYNMILNSFIIPALMSISMQRFVLTFINDNIITWVLPTAFLLRVFAPTRHMGNIMIALAVGLYVLVPLLYAFNLAMYDVVFKDCGQFAMAACDNIIDNGNCGDPTATCGNPDSLWNVARLLPQAFFLPNLTIALVVTFLAAIHKALRVIG